MKSKIKEVRGKVFETTDYSIFKTVTGNRVVSDKWVEKLAEKMDAHNLDDPIMVTEDYRVIDGQHRLAACMKLGIAVRFYVMKGAMDADVASINSDRKKWTSQQYCDYYFKRGNKNYQQLKYLAEQLGLGIQTAIPIGLRRVNCEATMMEDFKSGAYKIKDFGWACEFGDNYQRLIALVGKQAKQRTFCNVFAIFYKHPDFSFDRFYHAVKANMGMLIHATDRASYIKTFEKIYNYQLKGRKYKSIKFSRWIEDRGYVEVTEKELERRANPSNQWTKSRRDAEIEQLRKKYSVHSKKRERLEKQYKSGQK